LDRVTNFSHIDLQGRNLLTIPITLFHKATEIISLNLSRNLSLNIPKDFIQQCVNLRKIDFVGNEAERLPNSIASASRLTNLDISHNRLEDLSHASLEELQSLVGLNMSHNRLQSLPDAFTRFKSLRSLHIASNRLKEFPAFICNLAALVELDISFNNITSFPLEIGQLSALERLTASNNRLMGSLPPTFSNLTSLKELDLRFNYELQNIDVVAELPRLEALGVSHNRVTGFQQGFHKLRALHLNSNPVTRFSLTTVLPTLKFLNLSNAKIAAINESLFDKVPNLEKLILDRNHIVSLPPQIGKLRRLQHLSCANNQLAMIPKEIGQLEELTFLDLHYNNIKSLPREIWQLNSLVSLNLSSNIIREFPKPIAGQAAAGTSISEAASIKGEAIPENPGEEEVSDRLETATRVPAQQAGGLLSVGQDGPKGPVVSNYGQGVRKTSVLSKAGSDTGVPQERKGSASSGKMANTFVCSLKYLHLADNRLSDECFEQLSLLGELRVLNLSYNEIYDIPLRALSRMPLLNELYLSGNELTSLPAEDLEHIQHLKVLHLNGNKFQTLPAELGKIRKLLVLDVGNNALKYNISNWPYDWNW
jgi:adenylate cyclase